MNLFANAGLHRPHCASNGKISLYFPAEQGIPSSETGSLMTASTATSSMRTPRSPRLTPKNLLVSKAFGESWCTSETAPRPKIGLKTPAVSFRVYLAEIGTVEKMLVIRVT